jgi:hypothetical protein
LQIKCGTSTTARENGMEEELGLAGKVVVSSTVINRETGEGKAWLKMVFSDGDEIMFLIILPDALGKLPQC